MGVFPISQSDGVMPYDTMARVMKERQQSYTRLYTELFIGDTSILLPDRIISR